MSPDRSETFLLDTSTVIELASDPGTVASEVRTLFARPSTRLFVSAVSAWEVAIKTERGRLPGGAVLIDAWQQNLEALRATSVDITHADALAAGSLGWAHRDPFDRMLAAQAIRSGCRLATRDRALLDFDLVATLDTGH